jgi:hypothetical protein
MNPRKHITEELQSLQSTLPGALHGPVFTVPGGYFEGFAASVLARIKAEMNPSEELESLSPLLAGLSKKNPFTVPEGYFEALAGDAAAVSATDELSPELASLRGINPYTVPAGYFDSLPGTLKEKTAPRAKVVSMRTKWMRMAVAACTAGIITIAGLFYIGGKDDSAVGSQAWMERKLNTVSDRELDEFIKTADPVHGTELAKSSTPDVRALLKDVSTGEMDAFLEQVPTDDEELSVIN